MTAVRVLTIPFDTGARDVRTGRGPARLLEAGLARRLERLGHTVDIREVAGPEGPLVPEPKFAQGLWVALGAAVAEARAAGAFPLALTGVCYAAVGMAAGLGANDLAVCWFDAHGDVNTPETTATGFLDGMAVTLLSGRCWRTLTAAVPDCRPIPEERIVLLGARDLDPPEEILLAGSPMRLVPPRRVRQELPSVLRELGARTDAAYLHVDLDVLDAAEGRANHLASGGGLSAADLRAACRLIASDLDVRGMTLSAYDPASDPEGRVAAIALDVVEDVLGR